MKTISNEEYIELYRTWKVSGMSKAAFAAANNISRTAFYYWANKVLREESISGTPPGFSLINHPAVNAHGPAARINYPSGVSIDIFGQLDAETVKSLLF
jgi:hypothetical protein